MAALLVESIGVGNRRYELPPGIHTAGRGADNPIVLNHETVSTTHCELEILEDGRLRVRDLGSTNGTWVNGESTAEEVLAPGDVFMLGSVRLRFEGSRSERIPGRTVTAPPLVTARTPLSFWALIPGALRFPLKEDTLVAMLVVLVLEHAQLLLPGMFQLVGLVVGIAIAYYLFTTYLMIVSATIDGKDEVSALMLGGLGFDEMKEGFLQYLVLALVCLGLPGFVSWIPGTPRWVSPVLGLAGSFYFSMAFLALIVTDSLVGLNPFFTLLSIARAPLAYAVVSTPAMVVLGLALATTMPAQAVSGSRALQLLFGAVLTTISLYLMFAWARLLGLFYRCYRERLGWENSR